MGTGLRAPDEPARFARRLCAALRLWAVVVPLPVAAGVLCEVELVTAQPTPPMAASRPTTASMRAIGRRRRRRGRMPRASRRRANQSSSRSSTRGGRRVRADARASPRASREVPGDCSSDMPTPRTIPYDAAMGLELTARGVADGDAGAVAAALVAPGGVRELRVAGEAREDTLFPLASLTKPLVALAVLLAVEEAVMDLDEPVGEHLAPYRDG